MIAFTPHATNAATVTLNVDSLGPKPLRTSPNTELQAGVLIQGTPYVATYNNSDAAFYLQSFYGNPYNVPLGGMLPYVASTVPNSSFRIAIRAGDFAHHVFGALCTGGLELRRGRRLDHVQRAGFARAGLGWLGYAGGICRQPLDHRQRDDSGDHRWNGWRGNADAFVGSIADRHHFDRDEYHHRHKRS
jgi:hypothetical protein